MASRSSFLSRFQKLSLSEKQLIALLFFLVAYLLAFFYALSAVYENMSRYSHEADKLRKSMALSELEYLFYQQDILTERIEYGETDLKDDLRTTNASISSLIESMGISEELIEDSETDFSQINFPSTVIRHRWQDILNRSPDLPQEARYLLKEQFLTMLRRVHSNLRSNPFLLEGTDTSNSTNFDVYHFLLPEIGNRLDQLLHAVLLNKKENIPFLFYDLNNLRNKLIIFLNAENSTNISETKNSFLNDFLISYNELSALENKQNKSQAQSAARTNARFIEKIQQTFSILFKWQQSISSAAEESVRANLIRTKRQFIFLGTLLTLLGALAILFFFYIRDKTEKAALSFYVAMNSLKEGDFNANLKEVPEKDLSLIARTFNQMAENVRNLVAWFQQTGIQLTSSTTEITATAKEQEATLIRQEKTTRHIALAAKTIHLTAKELARMMNEINGSAEATSTLASSGKKELVKMEEVMKQLVEASSNISAKLAVLNEKAGTITNVISTIAKVADQTNLLSLNAAIEAEKAGEHGRSFSVIAREIRRLADQTASATLDIEKMVNEMVSAVSAGVMGVDKFSLEIHEGAGQLGLVSEQLSKIIEQVEQQTLSFEAVNHGMQEQSQNAEKINASIEELSLSVEQTTHSIKQFHKAIEEQHIAIKTMQRYRTDRISEKMTEKARPL